MKNILFTIYATLFLGLFAAQGEEFDFDQILQMQDALEEQLLVKYPNLEQSFEQGAANEKKQLFSNILEEVGNPVLSRQWAHPSGVDWPLVDWPRVDKLESFFDDQFKVVETVGVVAQTNNEMARFVYAGRFLSVFASNGKLWYQDWLLNHAKGNDSNLKWLIFFNVDELGIDHHRVVDFESGEKFEMDWNAWKLAYDQSNKLGKAILLKCMTRLALITEDWAKLTQIHLSVFNANDDDLKATALVKGDNGLGDGVIDKWKDIAQNSANAKLKNLAQEVLERQQIEIKKPE